MRSRGRLSVAGILRALEQPLQFVRKHNPRGSRKTRPGFTLPRGETLETYLDGLACLALDDEPGRTGGKRDFSLKSRPLRVDRKQPVLPHHFPAANERFVAPVGYDGNGKRPLGGDAEGDRPALPGANLLVPFAPRRHLLLRVQEWRGAGALCNGRERLSRRCACPSRCCFCPDAAGGGGLYCLHPKMPQTTTTANNATSCHIMCS